MKAIKNDLECAGWGVEARKISGLEVLIISFWEAPNPISIRNIRRIVGKAALTKCVSVGSLHCIIISK